MPIGCLALLVIVAAAAATANTTVSPRARSTTGSRRATKLRIAIVRRPHRRTRAPGNADERGAGRDRSRHPRADRADRRRAAGQERRCRALDAAAASGARGTPYGSSHRRAAFKRARRDEIADHHVAIATTTFGAAAALTGEQDDFSARWILAIGLERLADGDFVVAHGVLTPHCGETQTHGALLVACGTIHETFASLPADQLGHLDDRRQRQRLAWDDWDSGHGIRDLGRARLERSYQLTAARKYLDRAVALDESSTESTAPPRPGSDAAAGRRTGGGDPRAADRTSITRPARTVPCTSLSRANPGNGSSVLTTPPGCL